MLSSASVANLPLDVAELLELIDIGRFLEADMVTMVTARGVCEGSVYRSHIGVYHGGRERGREESKGGTDRGSLLPPRQRLWSCRPVQG